jgi:hypothetical protein
MPLDNYISLGTDVFLASTDPPLLELTNRSLEKALASDTDSEEVACAPKLMGVILQHCRGRVDACVGPYLALSLTRLSKCTEDEDILRDALLVLVADALYYDAARSLAALQGMGAVEQCVEAFLASVLAAKKNGKMRHYASKRDKKICILGLTSLLTVPDAALPPGLTPAVLQRVLAATVRALIALKNQQDGAAAVAAASGSLKGSGEGGESGNESDSEGDSDDSEEGDGDELDEATIE